MVSSYKQKRRQKILYFHQGVSPSEADYQAADELGGYVSFRRAALVSDTENPEKCDSVAGDVPKAYQHLIQKDEDNAKEVEPVEGEASPVLGDGVPKPPKPAKGTTAWKPNS